MSKNFNTSHNKYEKEIISFHLSQPMRKIVLQLTRVQVLVTILSSFQETASRIQGAYIQKPG